MTPQNPDLECPICSEYRPAIEHPQPISIGEGQWICGTCWFKEHTISPMKLNQDKEKDTP